MMECPGNLNCDDPDIAAAMMGLSGN